MSKESSAPSSRLRGGLIVGVAALCLLQWAPFFLRRGQYPLLSFSLFSGSYSGGEAQPRGGILQVRASPDAPWRPVDETKSLAMPHIAFGEYIASRFAPFHFKDRPLSLPGYARQDNLQDHREEACQWLLGEVRQYTHADATEMAVVLTYYVVSDTSERDEIIYQCRLPEAAEAGR